MSIPIDQLVVVALTILCIFFSLKSVSNQSGKITAIITIITTCITLIMYFFSDYNNSKQQKELVAIHGKQLAKMQTELGNKINALQANNFNIKKKLQDCQNQQIGNNNSNTQIDGDGNVGVSGDSNTVLSIIGSDGSTINYNALDKPFFKRRLNISTYTVTNIPINKGEQIFISATGSIRIGPFVGSSGPDGLGSGIGNISLESFNIIPTFKHAALMFKLSESNNWTQCGSSYKFTANKSGFLIFEVNDNDQGNNSGSYEVTVEKYKNIK